MRVLRAKSKSLNIGRTITKFHPDLNYLDSVYKDLHLHPELSYQESRTAHIAATHFKDLDFSFSEKVGRHGVVGILQNGDGPTVLLRADMDALPVLEKKSLPYASKVDTEGKEKPVMHACGHGLCHPKLPIQFHD
jgi:metal-dependent amidase/aminoacylase/carboxypeptidase family protein